MGESVRSTSYFLSHFITNIIKFHVSSHFTFYYILICVNPQSLFREMRYSLQEPDVVSSDLPRPPLNGVQRGGGAGIRWPRTSIETYNRYETLEKIQHRQALIE